MVVNLYVDHMMTTPPQTAEEVWNATREHSKLYTEAAHRIGLTSSEYREFQNALLDGKAVFVKLPHRIDVMAGNRHGSVYAVRHAVLPNNVPGWRVMLSSGAIVYVPQACGNLSLTRVKKVRPYVAAVREVRRPRLLPPPPPPEQQVVFSPPPPVFVPPPPPAPASGRSRACAGIHAGSWALSLAASGAPPPPCLPLKGGGATSFGGGARSERTRHDATHAMRSTAF